MLVRLFAAAAVAAVLVCAPQPSQAQNSAPTAGAVESDTPAKKPRRKKSDAKASPRAKSPGQLAAAERQRKCSAEWKDAKAASKTGGLTWPKFYSRCNARMKGQEA